jgi:VanZ family protein
MNQKNKLLGVICPAVLGTILTLGLWPFHSPRNEVAWIGVHRGLRLGRFGTVLGTGSFPVSSSRNSTGASLEIWVRPKLIWDSGTLVSFSTPDNRLQYSLRQSQTGLVVAVGGDRDPIRSNVSKLYLKDIFRKSRSVFLTITTGRQGTCIYADGLLAANCASFPLSSEKLTGRLILGDSPGQTDSWAGDLLGLSIYPRQLDVNQVFRNFSEWVQAGRPVTGGKDQITALYLFDEGRGRVVRNRLGPGLDLYIPEEYKVVDKIALEPFWREFSMSRSYWSAALKNIVGFVPFGFCFYAYLSTLVPEKRAVLVTVVLGTAVSVTIEVLQAFLPTRASGTTDILTNTLGTWIGVALYPHLARTLVRFFPWSPFPIRPIQ